MGRCSRHWKSTAWRASKHVIYKSCTQLIPMRCSIQKCSHRNSPSYGNWGWGRGWVGKQGNWNGFCSLNHQIYSVFSVTDSIFITTLDHTSFVFVLSFVFSFLCLWCQELHADAWQHSIHSCICAGHGERMWRTIKRTLFWPYSTTIRYPG